VENLQMLLVKVKVLSVRCALDVKTIAPHVIAVRVDAQVGANADNCELDNN
jgi:hypothetical protein